MQDICRTYVGHLEWDILGLCDRRECGAGGQAISQLELLDASSKNVIGGNPMTDYLSKSMMKYWSNSSYITEVANYPNVYMWSFSKNIVKALRDVMSYGSRTFLGNEQLKVVTVDSSAAKSIIVFAFVESTIQRTLNALKRI